MNRGSREGELREGVKDGQTPRPLPVPPSQPPGLPNEPGSTRASEARSEARGPGLRHQRFYSSAPPQRRVNRPAKGPVLWLQPGAVQSENAALQKYPRPAPKTACPRVCDTSLPMALRCCSKSIWVLDSRPWKGVFSSSQMTVCSSLKPPRGNLGRTMLRHKIKP